MIIKYKAMFGEVQKVEIERETPSFVIFKNGRKDKKNLAWRAYFDTESEAIDHLIEIKKRAVLDWTTKLAESEKHLKTEESKLADMLKKYGREK